MIVHMTPESMARILEEFLAGSRGAIVRENGSEIFDLTQASYSINGEDNRCLLHLWSAERNVVRRILKMEINKDILRLLVQRLGQSAPVKLEICRRRDLRTPKAKLVSRVAYRHKLQRMLEKHFPAYTLGELHTSADLENSFGPIYCRGLMHQGQSAFAVFGVNDKESQSSIDATLTFAILWLDVCRRNQAGRRVVEALKLFVPPGTAALTRQRMALLNANAARWQLYEFDEREDSISPLDLADRGNLATRLVHCPNEAGVRQRFAASIARIKGCMPEAEATVLSPAEVVFRRFGLEFARARLAHSPNSFQSAPEIVFGLGPATQVLNDSNAADLANLICSIGEVRHPEGPHDHPLWRSQPERWLESLVTENVSMLDERLEPGPSYSQVPAFSAADRAMIDILTTTRSGRLAVVELKAGEDIHLPLQGLDYWSRVAWHHARGEFQRFGYFPDRQISSEPPQLLLVAPALHVHPATDTLLRYLSDRIDWTLIGIDERWREKVKVVFRKRAHIAGSVRMAS